jgi:hypothetical protein
MTRQRALERWGNKRGVTLYQLVHQETNVLILRYRDFKELLHER